ncbi:unnamed protein product [Chrysoparadoxa australica]
MGGEAFLQPVTERVKWSGARLQIMGAVLVRTLEKHGLREGAISNYDPEEGGRYLIVYPAINEQEWVSEADIDEVLKESLTVYSYDGDVMDPDLHSLAALLRAKDYAEWGPEERMQLLKLCCDAACSSRVIREHLTTLSRHVNEMSRSLVKAERLAHEDLGRGGMGCSHLDSVYHGSGFCRPCMVKKLPEQLSASDAVLTEASAAAAAIEEETPKPIKKRGRPPKKKPSDNKPAGEMAAPMPSPAVAQAAVVATPAATPTPAKRKPGRPKGSKNNAKYMIQTPDADAMPAPTPTPAAELVGNGVLRPVEDEGTGILELELPPEPVAKSDSTWMTVEEVVGRARDALQQACMFERERANILSDIPPIMGQDEEGRVYHLFRGDRQIIVRCDEEGQGWEVLGEEAVQQLLRSLRSSDSPVARKLRRSLKPHFTKELVLFKAAPAIAAPASVPLATKLAPSFGEQQQCPQPEDAPASQASSSSSKSLLGPISSVISTSTWSGGSALGKPSTPLSFLGSARPATSTANAAAPAHDSRLVKPLSVGNCCLLTDVGTRPSHCEICRGSCTLYAQMTRAARRRMRDAPFNLNFRSSAGGTTPAGPSEAERAVLVKVLLAIASAIPDPAWKGGHWQEVSIPAWRAFVRNATTARELMQALLLLEAGIETSWLGRWWCQHWNSPAVALRACTMAAVAFRAYTLDAALQYDGPGTSTHGQMKPPAKRAVGRPRKDAKMTSKPLFKGSHQDTCSMCHNGGRLLLCDFCERSYHLKCVNLDKEPRGTWACPKCR